jgi:hypothetical protein
MAGTGLTRASRGVKNSGAAGTPGDQRHEEISCGSCGRNTRHSHQWLSDSQDKKTVRPRTYIQFTHPSARPLSS